MRTILEFLMVTESDERAQVAGASVANPSHYCGGTLVAQNLVLTAGHCLKINPDPAAPVHCTLGPLAP